MNNLDQQIATSIRVVEMLSGTPSAPEQEYAASFGRIATLESLREHLQWAIELEHSTIPPYLCALYSLDSDRNPEAADVVSSVMVEEMLHLTLAANLRNAVGGRPRPSTGDRSSTTRAGSL
jgi:rubrerythrin